MAENSFRESIHQPSDRIIVALDNMNFEKAEATLKDVAPHVGLAKGNSLAVRKGWDYTVERFFEHDIETMADPKFHDIPETVGLEVEEITHSGARLVTVHASAGYKALEYAVAGRERAEQQRAVRNLGILGITVLTSLDMDDCISIYGDEPEAKVIQFTEMAMDAGIDGVVCSGKELRAIRSIPAFDNLITVVPGITPEWAAKPGDQKRVVTPTRAIREGADFLVVGRAITQPPNDMSKAEAAWLIMDEIDEAL